jgi:hypothetical protein
MCHAASADLFTSRADRRLFVRRPRLSLARGPRINDAGRPDSMVSVLPVQNSASGDQLRVIDLVALEE